LINHNLKQLNVILNCKMKHIRRDRRRSKTVLWWLMRWFFTRTNDQIECANTVYNKIDVMGFKSSAGGIIW